MGISQPSVMAGSLLTEADVSQALHLSLACLRRWRLERRGPQFIKMGSRVRYRPQDLETWLESLPTGGSQVDRKEAISPNGLAKLKGA